MSGSTPDSCRDDHATGQNVTGFKGNLTCLDRSWTGFEWGSLAGSWQNTAGLEVVGARILATRHGVRGGWRWVLAVVWKDLFEGLLSLSHSRNRLDTLGL